MMRNNEMLGKDNKRLRGYQSEDSLCALFVEYYRIHNPAKPSVR